MRTSHLVCSASRGWVRFVYSMCARVAPHPQPPGPPEPYPQAPTPPERLALPKAMSDEDTLKGKWNMLLWIEGAGLHRIITAAMMHALSAKRPTASEDPDEALNCLKALRGREELAALLHTVEKALFEGIVDGLWSHVDKVQRAVDVAELTGTKLYDKFEADGTGFELKYGGLRTFFGGLEAKIGSPDPRIWPAMEREHTGSEDSTAPFTVSNYGTRTCPSIEWRFVTVGGALDEMTGKAWPREETVPDASMRRQPMLKPHLLEKRDVRNDQLRSLEEPTLLDEEVIGGRLYTGPMFAKYNDLLRGFGPNSTGTNRYVTSTHVINSCIVKTSKLTKAQTVYRGIAGGRLPQAFWRPDEYGIRGGVESAFMSTTYNRDVAMHYASKPGQPNIVFEMQMGMVDRGCELDWLSQYPHEKEVLFNPLTGLEVRSRRFEGQVLVVELRCSVNLNSATIEQVRRMHVHMYACMQMLRQLELGHE